MSAFMSSVAQYHNSIILSSMFSLIKWCAMSICFIHVWFIGWFTNAIMDLLSWLITIYLSCLNVISSSIDHIHRASFTAPESAWYSACVVDVATVCCFFVCYDIIPPFIMKMYPLILHLSSRSSAQSESHAAERVMFLLLTFSTFPKVNTLSIDPFKYWKTHFTTVQ